MKENKYRRPITARAARNGGVDIYDLIVMYEVTCPGIGHALKKMLCPGERGSKSLIQDLKEAAWSLAEAIQFAEDAAGTSVPHEPKPTCGECHGTSFVRGYGRWEPCPDCATDPVREGK